MGFDDDYVYVFDAHDGGKQINVFQQEGIENLATYDSHQMVGVRKNDGNCEVVLVDVRRGEIKQMDNSTQHEI